MQNAEPGVSLYVPGEQEVHDDAPVELYEPAGQSMQLAAPPTLNVPPAQG